MKQFAAAIAVAAILAGPVIAQDSQYAPQPGDANPPAPVQPGIDKPVADAGAKPGAPAEPVKPAADRDAAGVYQVFRNTDNQLNCDQLISEMNNLNAVIKSQTEAQAKAQPKGGPGVGRQVAGAGIGGALGGFARGSIARNVPGLGYVGAVAAASATDAASNAVGGAIANGGQAKAGAAAPATASNEQQRLNRVSGLFSAKGC
ncbi:MAG: hypothetical protein WCI21_06285 [Alphaproteobacteria bacterium]